MPSLECRSNDTTRWVAMLRCGCGDHPHAACAAPSNACASSGPATKAKLHSVAAARSAHARTVKAVRRRPYPGEQPSLLDGGHPTWQSRPALAVDADAPRAHSTTGRADRQPLQAVQTERQSDGRGRIVAAGSEAPRQHRREPAAVPAEVSPNRDHPDLWLRSWSRWTADLSLSPAMSNQHDRGALRATCCPTAATASRSGCLNARNF